MVIRLGIWEEKSDLSKASRFRVRLSMLSSMCFKEVDKVERGSRRYRCNFPTGDSDPA